MSLPPTAPALFESAALTTAFETACEAVGCPVDAPQKEKLAAFYALLLETNARMNLTRLTAPADFLYKLVLDSLVLSPYLPQGARVLDMGSGAGIPAVPLAIVRPDLTVTAVDAVGKKCDFVTSVAAALGLARLSAVHGRFEDLGHDKAYREQLDAVTAKAVGAMPALLEWGLPFLREGGVLLALKGPGLPAEMAEGEALCETLGGQISDIHVYSSPAFDEAALVVVTKSAPTPREYPRRPGSRRKKR
ncbi:MAG: 16S rRNA (guanine(527)-N(7))-methyltransferase RsmG [Candidatus Melainabacteria bacterium]